MVSKQWFFPESFFCPAFIAGIPPMQPSLLLFPESFFCIESSMSSASSMAIRQFHSRLDPSKTDLKTYLWCEHRK